MLPKHNYNKTMIINNKSNNKNIKSYQIYQKIIINKKTQNHSKTIKGLHKSNLSKTLKLINNLKTKPTLYHNLHLLGNHSESENLIFNTIFYNNKKKMKNKNIHYNHNKVNKTISISQSQRKINTKITIKANTKAMKMMIKISQNHHPNHHKKSIIKVNNSHTITKNKN